VNEAVLRENTAACCKRANDFIGAIDCCEMDVLAARRSDGRVIPMAIKKTVLWAVGTVLVRPNNIARVIKSHNVGVNSPGNVVRRGSDCKDPELAWRQATHAIVGFSIAVCDQNVDPDKIDEAVVNLLGMVGVPRDEAWEIARRPCPELPDE